jgi:hypothetical protein
MNVLPMETRVRIVAALTEGNGVRASARLEKVGKYLISGLRELVTRTQLCDEQGSAVALHPVKGRAVRC